MPIYIYGYLDVSNMADEELDDEHAWMTCLDLSSLNLQTGEVCSLLFGESKYGYGDDWEHIAHRRGLPASMGYTTTQEVREDLREAEQNPQSGFWGFTHISYEEIKQIDWRARFGADLQELGEYDWDTLFKLMDVLSARVAHQRLVVWFYW